jgi:hypothetical protein
MNELGVEGAVAHTPREKGGGWHDLVDCGPSDMNAYTTQRSSSSTSQMARPSR